MKWESSGPGEPFAIDQRWVPAVSHRRLLVRLLLVVVGSVLFTLALVPLYNVLCRATGLNGRTYDDTFRGGGFNVGVYTFTKQVDRDRVIKIEFTTTVMPGLPWEMQPLTRSLLVHPGELQLVKYRVSNLTGRPVSGQAIPGVTPGGAARYFHKIECFCFAHQTLEPYEKRDMVVAFVIRPDLDAEVRELTLAYAFFPLQAVRTAALSAGPEAPSGSRS
ncbi:MAG: cytochrome c oxidase assembly protein [Sterolibacterium sp.]